MANRHSGTGSEWKQGYFSMVQRRYGLKPGKSVEYRPVVFEVFGGFGNNTGGVSVYFTQRQHLNFVLQSLLD